MLKAFQSKEFEPNPNHTKLNESECVELLGDLYDGLKIMSPTKRKFINQGLNILYKKSWLYKG